MNFKMKFVNPLFVVLKLQIFLQLKKTIENFTYLI